MEIYTIASFLHSYMCNKIHEICAHENHQISIGTWKGSALFRCCRRVKGVFYILVIAPDKTGYLLNIFPISLHGDIRKVSVLIVWKKHLIWSCVRLVFGCFSGLIRSCQDRIQDITSVKLGRSWRRCKLYRRT